MTSHLSALDLLKLGDEDRQKPFLNLYWPTIVGVGLGVGTGIFVNFGGRRPCFSGIQKHVIGAVVWTTILNVVQKHRDEYYAEKDAVYRHYIELHPEDFPTPERKKIAELFEPWVPVR